MTLLERALFAAIIIGNLCSCVTTTITKPDGTIVTTRSQDPAVVAAVSQGVTQGAVIALQKGFAK